jgi:hypothetical protein
MLLENAKEGDFIYLDPPYSPESSTAYFTSYTPFGFDNNKDQHELATVFRKLDSRGCKLLLTNSDTRLIRNLYSGYPIVEVDDTKRAINCKGSKRAGHKDLNHIQLFNWQAVNLATVTVKLIHQKSISIYINALCSQEQQCQTILYLRIGRIKE